MAVRGLGCPVRFSLTAGQKGDAPQADALIESLPAEVVLADAAYDSDRLRKAIADKGYPEQSLTGQKISPRQASLCAAPSGRVLLLKAQAIPPRRNTLRENRKALSRRRHTRRNSPMAQITVHTS
jgi:hypothetical protein